MGTAKGLADPLGPGSPAWDQFDEAIIAYRAADNKRLHSSRAMKRYWNCRQACLNHVAKHGGDGADWKLRLDEMKLDYDYEP